jgi:hypothetical protein
MMKMTGFPLSTTDWAQVVPSEHPGESGIAFWRTQNFGEIRVRMVEYSPGYSADQSKANSKPPSPMAGLSL